MKVSIATAVLPVWRSPMISSRWPRPIGTSASSAFRPVWTGSWTDLRGMMPGALTSTRRRSAASIGPLPSIGLPRPSSSRPRRPLPTGTSTMVSVRRTVSPSLIWESDPKITIPTLSASRFRAMPLIPPPVPLANSTISPAWTLSSPWTRAIPSPTLSTVPTSETWASVPKLAIWSRMTLEISAARMSIFSLSQTAKSPSSFHLMRESVEFGSDRAVDPLRADLDDESAQYGGLDVHFHGDVAAHSGPQILLDRLDLVVVQRAGRGHFGGHFAAMACGE